MTSAAICRSLPSIKPVTVRSNLSRMLADGTLTCGEDGVYRLARAPIRLRSLPGSKGIDA